MVPFLDAVLLRAFERLGGKRYLSPAEAKNLEKELATILERMTIVTMENLDDFAIYESEFIARVLMGVKPDAQRITNSIRLRRMGIGLDVDRGSKSLPVTLRSFNAHKVREIAKKARQIAIQGLSREEAKQQFLAMGKLMRSQARSLSVTIVNHVATVAKDITYMSNRNLIGKVMWSSVLDGNTTDYCREHNGIIYDIGEGPRPPAHFNCRSVMIAILRTVT